MHQALFTLAQKLNPVTYLLVKLHQKARLNLPLKRKLLRAIFGEKASDVKIHLESAIRYGWNSNRCRVFTREGIDKDKRAIEIEEAQIEEVKKNLVDELRINQETFILELENFY